MIKKEGFAFIAGFETEYGFKEPMFGPSKDSQTYQKNRYSNIYSF